MPNEKGPLRIRLSQERLDNLKRDLASYYEQLFDEPLSEFRSDELVGFFLRNLGPQVYNQAISDARGFMLEKVADLEVEVYEPDSESHS